MTGVIWLVQLVHYPSFLYIDKNRWGAFHKMHSNWISPIVGPLMVGELLTGTLLAYSEPDTLHLTNAALIYFIFAATAWISVPLHNSLEHKHDMAVIERLIRTNWIRTGAYTIRIIILGLTI